MAGASLSWRIGQNISRRGSAANCNLVDRVFLVQLTAKGFSFRSSQLKLSPDVLSRG
jgi:hypothetical protein